MMAPPPKPKKRKPAHIPNRPAYQPHVPGRWNSFNAWLYRREVRVCRKIMPDAYYWTEKFRRTKCPKVYLARVEFREQVKREARGAGAVKKVKFGLGRNFRRREVAKFENEGVHVEGFKEGKCGHEARLRGERCGSRRTNEDVQDEIERTTELFRLLNSAGLPTTSSSQVTALDERSNAEDNGWVDIEEDDGFDAVEIEEDGILVETEDDWNVI